MVFPFGFVFGFQIILVSFCRYTPGEFPLPCETLSAEFSRMTSRIVTGAGYRH